MRSYVIQMFFLCVVAYLIYQYSFLVAFGAMYMGGLFFVAMVAFFRRSMASRQYAWSESRESGQDD